MVLYAHAKINLGLDVVDKREDGYHNIRTIMQTIGICDCIRIERYPEGEGKIHIISNSEEIPEGPSNLIWKAARVLMDDLPQIEGLKITLEKNIPVAAGLAGGSTDAAATLRGLNEMFSLGLDDAALCACAARVGADVPFLIRGGTALAEGIGEVLTPLPSPPQAVLLLAKPAVSISTKEAYESLSLDAGIRHPDMDGCVKNLKDGNMKGFARKLENIFEPGIIADHPVILQLKRIMEEKGALAACMSGSGPTVYGMFSKLQDAVQARKQICEMYPDAYTCITDFHPQTPEIFWPAGRYTRGCPA